MIEIQRMKSWESEPVFRNMFNFILSIRRHPASIQQIGSFDIEEYGRWIANCLLSKECYFYLARVAGMVAGIVWAIPLHSTSYQAHQMYMPLKEARRHAVAIGKKATDQFFIDCPVEKSMNVLAFIPCKNARAILVSKHIGFNHLAIIPKYDDTGDCNMMIMKNPNIG